MEYKASKKKYDKIVKDFFGKRFDPVTGSYLYMNNPNWREEKETAEDFYDDSDDDFCEMENEEDTEEE